MRRILSVVVIWVVMDLSYSLSTKMDFGEEDTSIASNSNKTEDEDVEVKHTIVVSTKLKNNNRRALHANNGEALTYNIGHTEIKKDDVPDIPVVNGYKAVETTQIRTPDTRHKTQIYPDSLFINRDIHDDYDVYPNSATNPAQWKPSNFFNNINWWSQENLGRNKPVYQNPGKFHRKITDDGVREFYCKKCMELSRGQGYRTCIQQRSTPQFYVTTTPKMKLDGKLAKLN